MKTEPIYKSSFKVLAVCYVSYFLTNVQCVCYSSNSPFLQLQLFTIIWSGSYSYQYLDGRIQSDPCVHLKMH